MIWFVVSMALLLWYGFSIGRDAELPQDEEIAACVVLILLWPLAVIVLVAAVWGRRFRKKTEPATSSER